MKVRKANTSLTVNTVLFICSYLCIIGGLLSPDSWKNVNAGILTCFCVLIAGIIEHLLPRLERAKQTNIYVFFETLSSLSGDISLFMLFLTAGVSCINEKMFPLYSDERTTIIVLISIIWWAFVIRVVINTKEKLNNS